MCNVIIPEVSLNPYSNGTLSDATGSPILNCATSVLILILMEHSLTSAELWKEAAKNKRLNPYSNGTLSDEHAKALRRFS